MHGIYVKEGQYSQHRGTSFCAMVFHFVMLLMIVIMQLSLQILYNISLESHFHGESEYKDVELFKTDEIPHKIASDGNFKQLELLIQE